MFCSLALTAVTSKCPQDLISQCSHEPSSMATYVWLPWCCACHYGPLSLRLGFTSNIGTGNRCQRGIYSSCWSNVCCCHRLYYCKCKHTYVSVQSGQCDQWSPFQHYKSNSIKLQIQRLIRTGFKSKGQQTI